MKFLSRHRHLTLGLALLALPAAASEGEVEYREHVMEAVGGHMQAAADILRGKVPHQDHLSLHADALNDLAGIAPLLFPPGSEGGDALPAIWQNADDFEAKLTGFQEAAAGFAAAARSGDGVGPALQQLGQSCKSCHDNYRKE